MIFATQMLLRYTQGALYTVERALQRDLSEGATSSLFSLRADLQGWIKELSYCVHTGGLEPEIIDDACRQIMEAIEACVLLEGKPKVNTKH